MKQRLYLIAGAILALVLSAGAGYGYSAWNASGEISGLEAAIAGHRCSETRFDKASLSAMDLDDEDDDE